MSTTTPADQVGEYAKNAFYVTIGIGVLAVQELQVQRRQLTQWVSGQTSEARTSFDDLQDKVQDRVKLVEERLTALEEQAESVLTELKGRLPESVKELAEQSVDYATQTRADLLELFGGRVPGVRKPAARRSNRSKAA